MSLFDDTMLVEDDLRETAHRRATALARRANLALHDLNMIPASDDLFFCTNFGSHLVARVQPDRFESLVIALERLAEGG